VAVGASGVLATWASKRSYRRIPRQRHLHIIPLGERLVALDRGEQRQLGRDPLRRCQGGGEQPLVMNDQEIDGYGVKQVGRKLGRPAAPCSWRMSSRSNFAIVVVAFTDCTCRFPVKALDRSVLQGEHYLEQG
jgi:hypothetical protein